MDNIASKNLYHTRIYDEFQDNLNCVEQLHKKIVSSHGTDSNSIDSFDERESAISFEDFSSKEALSKTLADITQEVLKCPNIKDKTPYDAEFSDNSIKFSISENRVALVNSSSYQGATHRSVRTYGKRLKRNLSKDEVAIFYKGLILFGTDFDMITYNLLPHRHRKQIYKFFLREERKNRAKIEIALKQNRENSRSRSAWIRNTFDLPNSAIEYSNFKMTCSDCDYAKKFLEYEENFVADTRPIPMVILDHEDVQLTSGLLRTNAITPSFDEVLEETALLLADTTSVEQLF